MTQVQLDIVSNRKAVKYSRAVNIMRILWGVAYPFFRFSLRPMFGWRRLLLRAFGARVGRETHIYNSARIYMPWNLEIGDWSSIGENVLIYNLGKVTIGSRSTISHRAHVCAGTHDYSRADLPLLTPEVRIGDDAWICADAFVGPGVAVGQGAVVGARAVALKDVDPWNVVIGNPATFVKKRVIRA